MPARKKKTIPDSVKDLVLSEASYRCAFCGQHDGLNLTMHHIVHESDGGATDRYNLIALCFNCHSRVHETKTISVKDIRKLKRHLVQLRLGTAAVNAIRLAAKNPSGYVVAAPWAVDHAVEEGLLAFIQAEASVSGEFGSADVAASYRITELGRKVRKTWL